MNRKEGKVAPHGRIIQEFEDGVRGDECDEGLAIRVTKLNVAIVASDWKGTQCMSTYASGTAGDGQDEYKNDEANPETEKGNEV